MIDELDYEAQKQALAQMAASDPYPDQMDQMQVADSSAVENEQEPMAPDDIRAMYSPMTPQEPAQDQTPLPVAPAPSQAMGPPRQAPERDFDWGRAMTALGGGDLGAYDRNRAERENAPYVAEQRRRQTQDYEEGRADKQRTRQSMLARLDAKSPESVQAQSEYARWLQNAAQVPGIADTSIGKELMDSATKSSMMTAAQIDRAFPAVKDLLGTALKGADIKERGQARVQDLGLKERGVAAQEAMVPAKIADIQQDNGRQGAMLSETIRHNKAVEDAKANPTVKLKMPGENTLKDFRQRSQIINQTKKAIELLPQIRYTGAGAESANTLLAKLPDSMDVRNDAERQLATILSTLRAAARNKLFGAALSKYDINDANSFLANLGNNPKTLKSNLEIALRALQDMNDMTAEQYPAISGEKIPGTNKTSNPNVDRAKAILADPNESLEKKAKAEKWLKANQ